MRAGRGEGVASCPRALRAGLRSVVANGVVEDARVVVVVVVMVVVVVVVPVAFAVAEVAVVSVALVMVVVAVVAVVMVAEVAVVNAADAVSRVDVQTWSGAGTRGAGSGCGGGTAEGATQRRRAGGRGARALQRVAERRRRQRREKGVRAGRGHGYLNGGGVGRRARRAVQDRAGQGGSEGREKMRPRRGRAAVGRRKGGGGSPAAAAKGGFGGGGRGVRRQLGRCAGCAARFKGGRGRLASPLGRAATRGRANHVAAGGSRCCAAARQRGRAVALLLRARVGGHRPADVTKASFLARVPSPSVNLRLSFPARQRLARRLGAGGGGGRPLGSQFLLVQLLGVRCGQQEGSRVRRVALRRSLSVVRLHHPQARRMAGSFRCLGLIQLCSSATAVARERNCRVTEETLGVIQLQLQTHVIIWRGDGYFRDGYFRDGYFPGSSFDHRRASARARCARRQPSCTNGAVRCGRLAHEYHQGLNIDGASFRLSRGSARNNHPVGGIL